VLWKHVDEEAGAEVRRQRRLVVSFHATVANYEYLVYWRFYQDGSIECEVRATGIMVTTHFAGEQPPYGTLVDERTYAPTHQHFIVARLDLDADGEENTVVASASEVLPVGPGNEHGLAVVQRSEPLRSESEGRQDYDWATQRSWKVVNERSRNGLGSPVGYKLVPGDAIPPMLDPSSPVLQRAGVLAHTLWVTPYARDERWPCGELVVQATSDLGLPAWTAADRPIQDTDVVLWYVFGIHHVTRSGSSTATRRWTWRRRTERRYASSSRTPRNNPVSASRSPSRRGAVPNRASFSTAVAPSATSRPRSVISASVERRSRACAVRRTSPVRSSPSTMLVTLVRWTCSRSPIFPSGIDPLREKCSSISAS
jgi:Copper amine oxidase, enzyme domain